MILKQKINFESIAFGTILLYILFSYIANDIVVPVQLYSISLYMFLAISVINIFINRKLKITHFTKWSLTFLIACLISVSYSQSKYIFKGEFYSIIINFVLTFFIMQINLTSKRFECIAGTYSISSLILVIILMVTGNMNDSTNRLGHDLLGNANILALMLMVSTMYSIWLLIYGKKNKIKNIITIVSLIFNYYALFYSGGRKFVIIPIIFLYILLLSKKDNKGRTHMLKYTILVLIIIVLLYLLIMNIPVFYDIIGFRMQHLINMIIGNGENMEGSTNIRMKLIQIGLKKIPENLIMGHGFDSFKYYSSIVTGNLYYSHNNFIELLYNQGVIGFLTYYYIYIYLFIKAFDKRIKIKYRAYTIGLIIGILIFEYGAVNYSTTLVNMMLCFAYKVLLERKLEENESINED